MELLEAAKVMAVNVNYIKGLLVEQFQDEGLDWESRLDAWKGWIELGGRASGWLPDSSVLREEMAKMNIGRHQVIDLDYFLGDKTEEEQKPFLEAMMMEGYSSFTNDW